MKDPFRVCIKADRDRTFKGMGLMEKKRFVGFYNPSVVLTYLGLVSAFLALHFAGEGNYKIAVFFFLLAGCCDMLDGTIARMIDRCEQAKKFGIQLDSLCDVCCFGFAPAIYGIIQFEGLDSRWIAYVCGFFLTLCGLIRLAYFNVMEEERQATTNSRRTSYQGLPITASAIMVPVAYIIGSFVPDYSAYVYCGFELLVSFLFIFNIPWPKPHGKQFILMGLIGLALFIAVLFL